MICISCLLNLSEFGVFSPCDLWTLSRAVVWRIKPFHPWDVPLFRSLFPAVCFHPFQLSTIWFARSIPVYIDASTWVSQLLLGLAPFRTAIRTSFRSVPVWSLLCVLVQAHTHYSPLKGVPKNKKGAFLRLSHYENTLTKQDWSQARRDARGCHWVSWGKADVRRFGTTEENTGSWVGCSRRLLSSAFPKRHFDRAGSGAWAIHAAKDYPDAEVIATDISPLPER